MKIVHIADTHIHNLKEHRNYKTVFSRLFESVKEQQPDLIVHCGDIFHNKVNISPEAINLAGDFFTRLSKIAPTYCILGNHDCLVSNSDRLDSISPIDNLIASKDFHFLKNSGTYKAEFGILFHVHSVLDRTFPNFELGPDAINIALYHGVVTGTVVNDKFQLSGLPISQFSKFDFTLLGDIHETNFVLDKQGRIRYPGSTIQQNFGETTEKGYLLWNITSKDQFDCKHIAIENKSPYVTLKVNKDIRNFDFESVPKESKIRIVNDTDLDNAKFRKLAIGIKNKFKFKNITIMDQQKSNDLRKIDDSLSVDNLHDIAVHEKLLREYLKAEKEETIQRVLELNRKYFGQLPMNESEKMGNWKITNLKWDNLFNYGEDNSIDFENLSGIIGIFGKNRSGKSSVIDSLLFSLFNKISKDVKSNQEFINSSKTSARAEVSIFINEKTYKIIRKIERTKSNKSQTSLEFSINGAVRNDSSRIETDKFIQGRFGTLEDFLMTSVSSQFGANNFINEGSTKRKEILANFLELGVFDELYEQAREDFSFLKTSLKKMEAKNYTEIIESLKANLRASREEIEEKRKKHDEVQEKISSLEQKFLAQAAFLSNIKKFPDGWLEKAEIELAGNTEMVASCRKSLESKFEAIASMNLDIARNTSELQTINLDLHKKVIREQEILREQFSALKRKLELMKVKKDEKQKSVKLLDDVPCKGALDCKLLRNAKESKAELGLLLNEISEIIEKAKVVERARKEDEEQNSEKMIRRHSILSSELSQSQRLLQAAAKDVENLQKTIEIAKMNAEKHEKEIKEYWEQQEMLKNSSGLNDHTMQVAPLGFELKDIKKAIEKSTETIAKAEVLIEKSTEEKENYENMTKMHGAFEKYMKAISSGGIPFSIIRNKLMIINEKVKAYLTDIAEFEVLFEDQDNNLNILLKDQNGTHPINMASGAEKMLASMAIRLSLLSISSLPRGNVFILDEPATSLDSENIDNFAKLLEMIKQDFSTVILISHIEALKDCCDKIVDISNSSGEAHIQV